MDPNATPAQESQPSEPINSSFRDQLPDIEQVMLEAKAAIEKGEDISAQAKEPKPGDAQPTTEPAAAAADGMANATPPAIPADAGAKTETETKPESLEQKVERLQNELRSRDGKHGSDKQAWMAKTAALERQLQELLGRLENKAPIDALPKPTAAATPPGPQEPPADPTDEQLREEYGADCIEELGRDYCKRLYLAAERRSRAERLKLAELVEDRVQKQLAQRTAQTQLSSAMDEIEAEVPGALELNDRAAVNGFGDYLDGRYGSTGFSRRSMATMAKDAIESGAEGEDLAAHKRTLVEIFKGFASAGSPAQVQPKPGNAPAKPDPKQYLTPSASPADRKPTGETITQAQAEKMLKDAEKSGKVDEALAIIREKASKGLII